MCDVLVEFRGAFGIKTSSAAAADEVIALDCRATEYPAMVKRFMGRRRDHGKCSEVSEMAPAPRIFVSYDTTTMRVHGAAVVACCA